MNAHFLLLRWSALRANKAWLLMDLHVTCRQSAAIALASVKHKVLFPFRFSGASTFCQAFRESSPEPLGWKEPWRPAGPSFCWKLVLIQDLIRIILECSFHRHLHSDNPSNLSYLFWYFTSPPRIRHPHHHDLLPHGRQHEAGKMHLHWANVPMGLPAAHFQGGKWKGEKWPFSLSALTRFPLSIWVLSYTCHVWNLTVLGTTPLSKMAEGGQQAQKPPGTGRLMVWCSTQTPCGSCLCLWVPRCNILNCPFRCTRVRAKASLEPVPKTPLKLPHSKPKLCLQSHV